MCVPESNQLTDVPSSRDSLAHLPRVLRQWRILHTLKAADAASRLGVAPATWGHWETGKRFPSSENLVNISRLTGIPVQHLFCPHATVCPINAPSLEAISAEDRFCRTCGASLYHE